MIFPNLMAPLLMIKCLVVGFRGSSTPRRLIAGARACTNIPPFISHEPLVQWFFRNSQNAIHEFIQIPFIIVKVIEVGLEIYK